MSPTVRLSSVNIKHRATMAPINRNNLRRRNINWKSALNFLLPEDTICSFQCHQLIKNHYQAKAEKMLSFKMNILITGYQP